MKLGLLVCTKGELGRAGNALEHGCIVAHGPVILPMFAVPHGVHVPQICGCLCVQCNCHEDEGQGVTFAVSCEIQDEAGWNVSRDDSAMGSRS